MPSSNAKSAATATDPGITEPITTKVLIIGSGFSGSVWPSSSADAGTVISSF